MFFPKTFKFKYLSKKEGFALLYSIVVIGVISVVGVLLLDVIIKQLTISNTDKKAYEASYASFAIANCLNKMISQKAFTKDSAYCLNPWGGPTGSMCETEISLLSRDSTKISVPFSCLPFSNSDQTGSAELTLEPEIDFGVLGAGTGVQKYRYSDDLWIDNATASGDAKKYSVNLDVYINLPVYNDSALRAQDPSYSSPITFKTDSIWFRSKSVVLGTVKIKEGSIPVEKTILFVNFAD